MRILFFLALWEVLSGDESATVRVRTAGVGGMGVGPSPLMMTDGSPSSLCVSRSRDPQTRRTRRKKGGGSMEIGEDTCEYRC